MDDLFESLLDGCAEGSSADGICIDTELEPLTGPGGPVKPAVYAGGRYQQDRRWASPEAAESTPVLVIDNVPSQANRLEEALQDRNRESPFFPELVLDLSCVAPLPAHLPRRLSSLEFPHRNADAYLRDARLEGVDFLRTDLGRTIFAATPQECGALMAWFPQALLFGFWQSHLGRKRHSTKHARSWVSEIVGWNPGAVDTRLLGMKGDPLNLNTDQAITSNPNDRMSWEIGEGAAVTGGRKDKLSEIGHGQVPFMGEEEAAAGPVSFARVTQRATVSFAQLRKVGLGPDRAAAEQAARALLVAVGLYAHLRAFGRGFALRSGAELRPRETAATWLGSDGDEPCAIGPVEAAEQLLRQAHEHAGAAGVPLDGWGRPPVLLTPKKNLHAAIRATWPDFDDNRGT